MNRGFIVDFAESRNQSGFMRVQEGEFQWSSGELCRIVLPRLNSLAVGWPDLTGIENAAVQIILSEMIANFKIDYAKLISSCPSLGNSAMIEYLTEELPHEWVDQYRLMTPNLANPVRVIENGFLYVYDFYYQFVLDGKASHNIEIEDRLIGVLGISSPRRTMRDVRRQRNWGGLKGAFLGEDDKGHYVAHTIGGGLEINMFRQNRRLNRGWSERGKTYRKMENYCSENRGTFLFSRPCYNDVSARPCRIEFAVLRADGKLWLETFEN